MIGRLRGEVASVHGDRMVLDVAGVGYEVVMTPKALASLPGSGESVVIHTHLHVREDAMTVFGFVEEGDRDIFRVLLGASGVGPRVALAMLSVFSADALRRVVATEDVDALTQVPGVGRRTAQKVILDLKPRLADLEAEVLEGEETPAQVRQALENLGYAAAEIRRAVDLIDPEAPLADQIRQALRELGR